MAVDKTDNGIGALGNCLDMTKLLMIVLDRKGCVTAVNENLARLLGKSAQDIVGQDWVKSFLPEGIQTDVEYVLSRTFDGEIEHLENYESAILGGDGRQCVVEWHNAVLTNGGSDPTGMLGIGINVTSQRRALDALRNSEVSYRNLFDHAPIGIYRSTPDGRFLMANPTLVQMLGYDSFDALTSGCNEATLYHADTPRTAFLDCIARTGELRGYEAMWMTRAGGVLHTRQNVRVVRDAQGGTLYYEGVVEDVSLQKEAQQALANQLGFEKLVTGISADLVGAGPDQIDAAVNKALQSLTVYMGVDRAYVYLSDEDSTEARVTHEWAAEGTELKGSELPVVDATDFAWSNEKIHAGEVVQIADTSELPEGAEAERQEFESEEVRSVVLVPLASKERVLGLVGFDSIWKLKRWLAVDIQLLSIVGEMIASALVRCTVEAELRYRAEFEELIATTSARFINLATKDVDRVICQSLGDLGEFVAGDCAFVCRYELGCAHILCTHGWQSDGGIVADVTIPVGDGLADGQLPPELEKMQADEVLCLRDTDPLPIGGSMIREYMSAHDIGALLCVPFRWNEEELLFVGVGAASAPPHWDEDIVSLVRIIGEIFASALARILASESLEEERMLIDALMDSCPDQIYFKDSESRFIRVSKSLLTKFGGSDRSDILGKRDDDFFSAEHADKALRDEKRIMETGEPVVGIVERESWADREDTWVSSTKLPLRDREGAVVGTFGISRDITDMKRAEQENHKLELQMQHTQKLKSLGLLSGGIAHDFNNLLMGILGNTNLALMELTPESEAWNRVKQIETVALRAAELTNQMLAYSGKARAVTETVNLTELVREMANLLEVSISKRVDLVYDFDNNVPGIQGDSVQVRQVVMNLITNASDAIGKKRGTIKVATSVVDCDAAYLAGCYVDANQSPGTYACVEVSDTGVGMDEQTQSRIFDPFFTTKVKGHGLGLAAVLGIVRSHGGMLKVYSEVGKGTNFKLLFPCDEGAVEQNVEETEPEDTEWQGRGRVLVIDDDEIVCTVTEQILLKLGFDVIKASDSLPGLRMMKADAENIVAVLLDVTLPHIPCVEMIDKLHNIKPDLPILLMSGYNEQAVNAEMEPGSYKGFLQKPFTADQLSKVMQALST